MWSSTRWNSRVWITMPKKSTTFATTAKSPSIIRTSSLLIDTFNHRRTYYDRLCRDRSSSRSSNKLQWCKQWTMWRSKMKRSWASWDRWGRPRVKYGYLNTWLSSIRHRRLLQLRKRKSRWWRMTSRQRHTISRPSLQSMKPRRSQNSKRSQPLNQGGKPGSISKALRQFATTSRILCHSLTPGARALFSFKRTLTAILRR